MAVSANVARVVLANMVFLLFGRVRRDSRPARIKRIESRTWLVSKPQFSDFEFRIII
jgi:hypothetical protein